jgi:Flp pilus assembly protein TadG
MRHFSPRRADRHTERGQSLVEFALVLPVFMMLVFGILDGGRAILTYNEVAQSTRNVARVASVSCFDTVTHCSTASGTPIGNAMAAQISAMGPTTWTLTCIDPATNAASQNCTAGDIVRVRASATVTLVTPVMAQAFGGTVDVEAISEATVIQ